MSDSPGPCPSCGAPLVKQTDRRKPAGYSLRCSVGGHTRPSLVGRRRNHGAPRVRRAKVGRPVGTQSWMTNPTVAVCAQDNCFFDRATCPVHRKI